MPERRHQKKMTEADRVQLADILKRPDVRKNGKIHIATVSALTGMSYQQVYGFMNKDPYWKAQLGDVNPGKIVPKEEGQIDADPDPDAPPTSITISNAQFDEYRALIRQNRKMMAADWQKLGMTEDAGRRMEHYSLMGTAPTSMILRSATGQLISNLELLDRIVKGDCERVLTGAVPEEIGKNGEARDPGEVERDWRYMVYSGMELQLKMFSHLHKVQAMMARVMRDLTLMNGGQAPQAKGEFTAEVPATAVSERPA